MKSISYLCIAIFLLFPSLCSANLINVPSLSKIKSEENIRAIVIVGSSRSREEIQELTKTIPGVKVRKVFQYALKGFSVEGRRKDIQALKKTVQNLDIYEVVKYTSTLEESVPFVGGNDIRGLFDSNNNRLTGKGVKVGIIDTGIDYNHPDLKKSYRGGKDLVDLDDDPMETVGSEQYSTFHGTHVAGIIAANGKVLGVAPEAEIFAYRALGPGGTGDSESVITAIDAAIEDQMDILNLSLGNSINGPDLPITIALNKAVEKGVTAVVSSGNSGPNAWTVGSPGTSSKAISVGASAPPIYIPFLQVGLGHSVRKIPLHQIFGAKKWSLFSFESIVYVGEGTSKEISDVQGKIALIDRGKLSILEKIKNAEIEGAKAVVILNNNKGLFITGVTEQVGIPAMTISKEDGKYLKDLLLLDQSVSVKSIYVQKKDLLAKFSSRGPVTVSWEIKPDVVAPGVSIDSTVPGGYLSLHGTSMAAPHVAGSAALLKQAHPDWGPEQIKSALMTTAKLLINEQEDCYRTFEQGAGRIQVNEAVKADTFIYPSSITFGFYKKDSGEEEHLKQLIVENKSKVTKFFSFSVPRDEVGLVWKLPLSFSLKPKEKKNVTIGLSINSEKLKKGIYDGFLHIKEGSSQFHIPYLYMNHKPNFPKIMGFQLEKGYSKDTYRYEMYLPDGGEELIITLYDIDSFHFVGYLDRSKPAPKGFVQKEISKREFLNPGTYHVLIVLKKGEDSEIIHKTIQLT